MHIFLQFANHHKVFIILFGSLSPKMDREFEDHWFRHEEEEEIEKIEKEVEDSGKQLTFVLCLKKYPILLDKSQVPTVKAGKKHAVEQLILDMEKATTDKLTAEQVLKKINNMKTTVKKKTDRNATGNKKIVLNKWEKIFLEMLEPETNPVYCKVPGEICI